jgi:hypothetical protein
MAETDSIPTRRLLMLGGAASGLALAACTPVPKKPAQPAGGTPTVEDDNDAAPSIRSINR